MTQLVDNREVAVMGVNTVLISLSLATVVLVHLNRTYIPLKCKNIPLIYTLFCTMFLWYIGDIFTYQPTLVKASRPICILTMSWMRISLGIYSVVSCHIFRIYQYYCIFKLRIRATGWYLWIPIAIWSLLPLSYGIMASTMSANGIGNAFIEGPPMCISHKPLYFVAVGFLILLLICWIYATLMMSRVNVCFNEYRELLVVIICTISIVILQVVLRWIPNVGNSGFGYNTFASISDMLIGLVGLLVIVFKPLFHCYFGRREYLSYFLHTLKQNHLQTQYEMANGEEICCINSNYTDEKNISCGESRYDLESSTDSTTSMTSVLFYHHRSVIPPTHQYYSEQITSIHSRQLV
ncbi:hypothetical protein COEREDRAFT_104188 [Coemansia reversa NRRL 1564]|uniref:G-protein coupled receptors family 3 profile domain-containing protein n=1 Tax=Coemansia reversa (strain ATCC 12441 / NRRL 1564) TaxID=763665 RepID=A0A2G5B2P0_COERN|nr:hypothetical protein COEREDRAFT_104188 [Coemansia reversa NRRL 1564]|eukprot:PIA13289.1 hypothetical protein COEREDRAFT_104188 [Coemansia reversa NRRL 1564]